MVGGDYFKIEKLVTAVNNHGDILVGGTNEHEKDGNLITTFLYLLRNDPCELVWKVTFDNFSGGVGGVTWSYDNKYAYMIAYEEAQDMVEKLVVMRDPFNLRDSDGDGDPDVWTLESIEDDIGSSIMLLSSSTLFAHPTNNN